MPELPKVKAEAKEEIKVKNEMKPGNNPLEIAKFLKDFEGLHLKSYSDHRQFSIGLGTKSYKGEVITEQEAYNRATGRINDILNKYNLQNLDLDKQKAIVSFVYNIGSLNKSQKWLLENGKYCALGNNFTLYVYASGKKAGGLVKRRNIEKILLCK